MKWFARIDVEMVSLAAVEGYVFTLWPVHSHAVVTQPDPKKGEQLVQLTESPTAARQALIAFARKQGVPELNIPKAMIQADELSLLVTGNVDYVKVRSLVETATEPAAAPA